MRFLFLFTLSIVSANQLADGANILYLSHIPSPSHFIWCKSLLTSLHERGHNITALVRKEGQKKLSKEKL